MIRVAVAGASLILTSLSAAARLAASPLQGAGPSGCPAYRVGDPITFTATIVAAPGEPHLVIASLTLAIRSGTSNSIVIPPAIGNRALKAPVRMSSRCSCHLSFCRIWQAAPIALLMQVSGLALPLKQQISLN